MRPLDALLSEIKQEIIEKHKDMLYILAETQTFELIQEKVLFLLKL